MVSTLCKVQAKPLKQWLFGNVRIAGMSKRLLFIHRNDDVLRRKNVNLTGHQNFVSTFVLGEKIIGCPMMRLDGVSTGHVLTFEAPSPRSGGSQVGRGTTGCRTRRPERRDLASCR